jgi:hypothetical protein
VYTREAQDFFEPPGLSANAGKSPASNKDPKIDAEDDSISEGSSVEEAEVEGADDGGSSLRPVRSSKAKKPVTYEEQQTDGDDDDDEWSASSLEESEAEEKRGVSFQRQNARHQKEGEGTETVVKGEQEDTREMSRGNDMGKEREGKADKEREMEEDANRERDQMQKLKEAGTPATIKKDDARLAPIKKKRRNIFKKFAVLAPMAPSTVQAKVDKLSQGEEDVTEEPIVAPTTREEKTPCNLGMSSSQIEISQIEISIIPSVLVFQFLTLISQTGKRGRESDADGRSGGGGTSGGAGNSRGKTEETPSGAAKRLRPWDCKRKRILFVGFDSPSEKEEKLKMITWCVS